jgi:hypothetical protein
MLNDTTLEQIELPKRIPMTQYQIRLFNFFFSELKFVKCAAKRLCRTYNDVPEPDEESQLAKLDHLRELRCGFGVKIRYCEIEWITEDDYFFEDEIKDNTPYVKPADNRKILRDFCQRHLKH